MSNQKSRKFDHRLKTAIGFLLSFICLYFLYQSFDWYQFVVELRKVNYFYLFLSIICLAITIIIRGLRWAALFKGRDVNFLHLSKAELIGFWGNSILPLRIGELIRIHYAKRLTKQSYTRVVGTVFLERIIDIIMITPFLLFIYYLFPMDLINSKIKFLLVCLAIIISIFILVRYLFVSFRKRILDQIDRELLVDLLKRKNIILFYSILIWGLVLTDVYLVQLSMNLSLSFIDCIYIMLVATIVYSIPSSPGTIGTFHLAIQEFMIAYLGQSIHTSQVFAFILHAHSYLFFIIVGTFYFLLDSKKIMSFRGNNEIY